MISGTETELGVLLIGGDFQSLGVMRALAAEQIPCFLLSSERGIASHSRFASRQTAKFDLLGDSGAVEYLLELAERESLRGWVIFCVNDDTVEFLAKNYERLSEAYVVAVPPWTITQNFFDKDNAYKLAEKCGIPIPRSYQADSFEQLMDAEPEFPLVLKPTFKKNYYDVTKRKAILVRDETSLKREYESMLQLIPAQQIVVQEFIDGGTKNLYSVAALFDGTEIVSGLTAIRLRQHPMDFGHATTYAEQRDCQEIWDYSKTFLKALGYRGVAEIEFMYDSRSGNYKFIEMNGRFFGWHSLTQSAGLNLPADLFRVMTGQAARWQKSTGDGRWMRAITDVPTVIGEVTKGRMSLLHDYVPTLMAKKCFAVWSWRDPVPSIVELIMAPYLWFKKGF